LLIGFSLYELRREGPLLDVRIFKSAPFSGGAASIATAFFCLFGFIFLITQYFQFVRGYSALSAGVHTLPFAITAAVVTPLGAVVALRLGSRVVVAGGLLAMAAALIWQGLSIDCRLLGPVIGAMVLLSFGFSLTNAPSTAAIMGSLRPEQIGAGSAVNNTTRELGGTLGVAVVGSVLASLFAPAIRELLMPAHLPSSVVDTASSSMAAAVELTNRAPAATQPHLVAGVTNAFMSGLHRGCLVAAGVAIAVALVAWFTLPGRAATAQLGSEAFVAH
jgi:hypothetical protein